MRNSSATKVERGRPTREVTTGAIIHCHTDLEFTKHLEQVYMCSWIFLDLTTDAQECLKDSTTERVSPHFVDAHLTLFARVVAHVLMSCCGSSERMVDSV